MRKFNSPPSFTLYNVRVCTNSDLVEIRNNFWFLSQAFDPVETLDLMCFLR